MYFLALAFCNYTKLQTKRRQLLKKFTFPHAHSANWDKLDRICRQETQHLISILNDKINGDTIGQKNGSAVVDIKPLIMKACGNIFNDYFCSRPRSDYKDEAFNDYIHNFDKIFWEVNNGRACDFLPWLMPMMKAPLREMEKSTAAVRSFVEDMVIEPKRQQRAERIEAEPAKNNEDFLDSLMRYIDEDLDDEESYEEEYKKSERRDSDVKIDRQIALFALEDILGGHCAVGNITLRIINDLAENNNNLEEDNCSAQEKIQHELDVNLGVGKTATVSLDNKKDLHWMTAAAHETIRLTCSPIVPHQASTDSTIKGKLTKISVVQFKRLTCAELNCRQNQFTIKII